MREQPGRAALGGMIMLIVAALVGWLIASEGLGMLMAAGCAVGSVLLLTLALHKFYFVSTFEVDDEGISTVHFMTSQRMRWEHVRRFLHDERGGYLSRRAVRNRLDAWQGMHLQWPPDGEERSRAIEEITSRVVGTDA